ncbi:MAG: ABC transporter [Bacteroidetes bacterium]|nr:MAG: ABC transporter [Bacteroidota bacterium]
MKRDWTSRTSILLVGAILVLLNLIGLNLFARLDLTDDDVYSLSPASIRVVEQLEDPVTFKVFFTPDLPAPYSSTRRFLRDKLDDYRAYGGQKVQYTFVDPASDAELQEEADRYGIPPVQIQVIENDNLQIKNAYMGLAILYGGEREIIPVVEDLSTLEYDITSALIKLTRERTPIVGFLTGHGEPVLAQDMPALDRALRRNYDVRRVALEDSVLTPRPDVLLVVAPEDSLPEAHLRALDAYLMDGGKAGFLVNRVAADLQMGQATELTTGLEGLLETYGIRVAPNLVMDRQSSSLTVQRSLGGFIVQQAIEYPFLPVVTRFNPDHPMVNRLREVALYYASAIDTSAAVPEGVVCDPLLLSSPQSSLQEGFFFIQPMPNQPIPPLRDGPYVLAAACTGTFPSAYEPGRTSAPTRLAVVGDGDFVNARLMGSEMPGNVSFVLNMVDWLAQDDDLLAIRTKTIAPRPLLPVSEAVRPWIKYANMLGPVLLVLLFGLFRWRSRRQRARRLAATFRPLTARQEEAIPTEV